MNPWLLLGLAITCEVIGSTNLRLSQGFTKPIPSAMVLVFMGGAFYFLSQTLSVLPLSITYAVWTGVGLALTFAVSVAFFQERITAAKMIGLLLIAIGAVALNLTGSGKGA
jgi:multidrug transporter EmrE-like cation transporter